MAGSVIRDMVKNYLSAFVAKDLLELNVKVRWHVMFNVTARFLCHYFRLFCISHILLIVDEKRRFFASVDVHQKRNKIKPRFRKTTIGSCKAFCKICLKITCVHNALLVVLCRNN